MKYNTHQPVLYRIFLMFVATLFFSNVTRAQTDTLELKLAQAEKLFLDSNLYLLASHYNVDVNKAYIKQAKLWDNPVLITDQSIYANGHVLEHGKDENGQPTGQFFIQVQQLIKTAGKRRKLIDLATTNVKISELQLQQVMLNLRYQLRQDYYTIAVALHNNELYQSQLEQLNHLQNAMKAQLDAGNIALKDYLRIQALVISLQQDIADLGRSIIDAESDLKTLLHFNDNQFIKPLEKIQTDITLTVNKDVVFDSAKQNNPNYLLQQTQVLYQKQNLAYQKALRSPDVTLGPEYDHNSNYAPYYVGLTVSLPLPLLNKNQGNIAAAGYSIKQQQALATQAETELKNNVDNAYQKLVLSINQSNATQNKFYESYGYIFNKMMESYRQKQVGLLEFLDFFDAYKEAELRLQQQHLNLQLAKEELNYQAGADLIK